VSERHVPRNEFHFPSERPLYHPSNHATSLRRHRSTAVRSQLEFDCELTHSKPEQQQYVNSTKEKFNERSYKGDEAEACV
jgi:hypothetical protein